MNYIKKFYKKVKFRILSEDFSIFFYSEKLIKIQGPEFHQLNVPLYEVNSP